MRVAPDHLADIAELLPTSTFLRAILDELPVGVVILDDQRRPIQWNRKCVELQGLVPDGQAWLDGLHPDDRDHVITTWKEAAERNETWAAVYRFVHPGGRVVWVSGRATPLRVDGRTLGYVRTMEDVTSLNSAKEELSAANLRLQEHAGKLEDEVQHRTEKLTEALAELDRLSYAIVHDMRAPLRTLQGFSTLLLESHSGSLEPQAKDMLKRMAEAARKQDDLISGVLAYHSYVRDKFPLTPVSLDETVNGILGTYANFQPASASIEVRKPLGWAIANEILLTQTVSALLNNAVKFVAPGTHPEVRIWTEQSPGTVRLFIQDNGIGIAPDYHRRIFDVFQTLHDQRTYSGTGIGLPLAAKAVQRMNGTIGVESAVGKGARFWIELPEVTA